MGRSISLALLIFLVGGCGHSYDFHGVWTGSRGFKAGPGEDPGVAGTAARVQVEVREDGTFSAVDGGIPLEGLAVVSGATLHLRPERVLNAPAAKAGPPLSNERTLKFNSDGTANYSRVGSSEIVRMLRKAS